RSRVRPGEFEIGAELQHVPPLLLTQGRWLSRLERGDLALEPVHDLQRLVPAALQLTGDQAIVGIDGVILPTGMRRREARLLQRQIELPLGRRRLARLSLERLRGGTDLTGRIVGNHLLVPLELAPGDIALVLILEQHVHSANGRRRPRLTRLRPSSTLTLLIVRPKA